MKMKKTLKVTFIVLSLMTLIIVVDFSYSRLQHLSQAVELVQIPDVKTFVDNRRYFNVGAYNIAHGRGNIAGDSNWQKGTKEDMLLHLDKIAEQIQFQNLDIVVLNEVDFSAAWTFHLDQAAYIARKAGYAYCVEQNNIDVSFPFYNFRFGNAILSRYPVTEMKFLKFKALSRWEDTFAGNHDGVLATLQTPYGSLGVVAVHLEYRNESTRVLATREILKECEAIGYPVIAAGDFNSTPSGFPKSRKSPEGENAIDLLLTDFQCDNKIKPQANYFTFPSKKTVQIIDWVMVKGNIQSFDSKVIESNLSDHQMIISKLKIIEKLR